MSTVTQGQVRTQPPAQLDSRMLAGGVDLNDYLILKKRSGDGEDWVEVAEELGDKRAQYARAQLALGHTQTARYFFFAAAAVYRVGQYGILEVTDERLRIYHKLDEAFSQFAALFESPMTKVAIPYKGYDMEGWLIEPQHCQTGSPVVLMLPGATGFKEEFMLQAQHFIDRGVPVLLMDGPGQGTTVFFNKGYLEVHLEEAYSKMIDFLEQDGRFGPVGIIGGSTGGYYVSRAAATDPRIKGCVWNSGSYYPEELCKFAPIYYRKFAILFGKTEEEMKHIWPLVSLEGLAERISCPFLVVHSESDPLFSLAGARRAFDESPSIDKELKIYPGTNHCQAGAESEAFRYMADWLIDRLYGSK